MRLNRALVAGVTNLPAHIRESGNPAGRHWRRRLRDGRLKRTPARCPGRVPPAAETSEILCTYGDIRFNLVAR